MNFREWAGFAKSAQAIYRNIQRHSDYPGAVRFREDRRFLVRYAWIEESDRHIVCFRGSVTRDNGRLTRRSWELNFRTELRRVRLGPNTRMHAGYLHQAAAALRYLRPRILDGKAIYLLGHSQGGALALATALQLARVAPGTPIGVFTFGQPRVGNRALARFVDLHVPIEVIRLVNSGDVVTCVPLKLQGYEHCEAPIYLLGKKRFSENHVSVWPGLGSVRAHGIALYRRRLEDLDAGRP